MLEAEKKIEQVQAVAEIQDHISEDNRRQSNA